MKPTTLSLHTGFRIGEVDPRIFGGFLEHIGRAVYQGVYDPESANADGEGFRSDVMDALRRLEMTVMRYPGGNFASGYHWLDGIGPREKRPAVRDLAWQSIEPNRFGTDEFVALSKKMRWIPMLTVNLGTGTPEEARNWVEYCNSPAGTMYSDMRAANGRREPHSVKLWCLGNEMDGPWQIGHVPAEQYAIRAQQAAKMMKDADSSIELVVCGSSVMGMNTYMDWDRRVLEHIGDLAEYVSLHKYVGNPENNTPDYLAVTNSIDRQIEDMDAACRCVQAKCKNKKRQYLCFDEWNVWYKNREVNGAGKFAPHLLEEIYNLEDALVVAGFLNSFLRHADVVKIANLAQIANVIAPLLTKGDDLLIQSIFHPFEMFSKRRDGVSLRIHTDGPDYESPSYGTVNCIDSGAILGKGKLHVFLTNRDTACEAEVKINPADCGIASLETAEILSGPGAKAFNSFENRDVVAPAEFDGIKVSKGQAACKLPPLSFAAITFRLG